MRSNCDPGHGYHRLELETRATNVTLLEIKDKPRANSRAGVEVANNNVSNLEGVPARAMSQASTETFHWFKKVTYVLECPYDDREPLFHPKATSVTIKPCTESGAPIKKIKKADQSGEDVAVSATAASGKTTDQTDQGPQDPKLLCGTLVPPVPTVLQHDVGSEALLYEVSTLRPPKDGN